MVVERSGGRPLLGRQRRPQCPALYPVVDLQDPERAARDRPRRGVGRHAALPGPEPERLRRRRAVPAGGVRGRLDPRHRAGELLHPVFQDIAREIGAPAYARELKRLEYGNQTIARGQVDRFWLDGPLTISAREQVDFLRRLQRGALPVSRRAVREVDDMLVLDAIDARSCTARPATSSPRLRAWAGGSAGSGAAPRAGRSHSTSTSRDPNMRAHAPRSARRS